MGPNYPQGYPHPVDFLCVGMWAEFSIYDTSKKVPEIVGHIFHLRPAIKNPSNSRIKYI
jgi:hypothetical protein